MVGGQTQYSQHSTERLRLDGQGINHNKIAERRNLRIDLGASEDTIGTVGSKITAR